MRPCAAVALTLLVGAAFEGTGCAAFRTRASARTATEPHYRAFWVDTFNTALNTPADVAAVVANARAAHANALFVQVRRRGDSWYLDSLEPLPDEVPIARDFDPLRTLIADARAAGLEVHAFVIVCALWNSARPPRQPNHVFNRHGLDPTGRPYQGRDNWLTRTLLPDGTATSVDGHRVGSDFWMDPGHPDASAYTVEVLTHLVRQYEIDGLHLDRIRYPEISIAGQTPSTGANTGYNATSVARFQRRHGIAAGSPPPAPNDAAWGAWRRDQVSALVRRIYLNAVAIRPAVKVSAALIAFGGGPASEAAWTSAEAYWRVHQDWRAWLEEGILDLGIPMNYKTEHTAAGRTAYDQWDAWAKDHTYGRAVLIGLGAFLNAIEGTLRQVRRSLAPSPRGGRASGVVFFSMANANAAIAANPFALPMPRDTPRRTFADFAAALRTGRSTVTGESFEPSSSGVFAEPVEVPSLEWKRDPQVGHLMGLVKRMGGEAVDSADVIIARADAGSPPARAGRMQMKTTTDGGGFYGGVDLAPGRYRVTITPVGESASTTGCTVDVQKGRVARLDLFLDPRYPALARCVAETKTRF